MIFTQNSSMLHSPAHHFFTTLKSNKVVWTSYWRTMASLATPFSKINPCAQITEQQNNDCWIRNMEKKHEDRESRWHPLLTQCLKSLASDSSANTAYIYSGNLWRQTCCSAVDGKLQLIHAPGDKKWHKQVTMCRDSSSAWNSSVYNPTLHVVCTEPCFLLICYAYTLLYFNVFMILYFIMPVHPLVCRNTPYG